jgi:Peptidase family M1 domain
VLRLVVVVAAVAACNREPRTPTVKAAPKIDGPPGIALRGGGGPKSQRIANYKIDAKLDATRHQITATETLTWTNAGQSQVDAMPFHLYLNAFKNEQSLFMRSSHGTMRGAHATDGGWGYIQVDSVQVGGVELASKLHYLPLDDKQRQGDETVVELPLPQPVAPGATLDVTFKFTAQLPEVFARTGYKGDFHMIGQWFPKVGVRVGPPGLEHWECNNFHLNTEFFADFGTYDVKLTVPNTYRVAATGVLVSSIEAPGNAHELTYHAEDVHDFAWMADPYMDMMSGQAKVEDGSVEVRVYYRKEQEEFAQRHLAAGIGAIEKFSADFLPYPWPVMSIIDPPVDAAMGAGGMEYPTLVTTAADSVFFRPGMRVPEYVTVHEVGHNWFQGMLASNEAEEAWLDEGINEWADAKVMDELYGSRASAIDWMGWQAEVASLRRALGVDPDGLPSPIATAAYAFVDNANYGAATYESTLRAMRTLEQIKSIGSVKFAAAMKAYTRAFAFHHPTGRDLFATLSKELGQDLSWFFGPVFHQVGGLELEIRSASCKSSHDTRGWRGEGSARKLYTESETPETGGFDCEVVVQNTGTIHVPVEIELRFADGSSQRLDWDDRGESWQRFAVQRSSRLTEVWIDPDNKVLLDSPIHHHRRLEGDGAASLRAAAWFSSSTQTVMQMVGP